MIEKFNTALNEFMEKWGLHNISEDYDPMFMTFGNETMIAKIKLDTNWISDYDDNDTED